MKIKRIILFIMTLFASVLLVSCGKDAKPKTTIDEMIVGRNTMDLVFTIKKPSKSVNLNSIEGKLYYDGSFIRVIEGSLVEDTESTFKINVSNLSIDYEYKLEVTVIVNKKVKTLFTKTFKTKLEGSSSEAPIIIKTVDDFLKLEDDYNAYYILENDLDFSDVEEFTPLFLSKAFAGNFDGNNKTIKNVKIDKRSTYVGLFGRNSGTIKNLNIDNMTVNLLGASQSSQYISILSGRNTGAIENVNITNSSINTSFSHSGIVRIGGLAGYSESGSNIKNSTVEIDFNIEGVSRSEFYLGGIVGELNGADMSGSKAKTTIIIKNTTTAYIGGAIGHMTNSTLNDSSAKESEAELDITINTKIDRVVSNSKTVAISIGGFVGKMLQSSIVDAYAKAKIVYPTAHNVVSNQSSSDKISLGGFAGSVTNRSTLENVLADSDISLGIKQETSEAKVVDVKFELGYDNEKPTVVDIYVGTKIDKPDDPVREGYNFIGWYLGNEEYDFDLPVNHTINLVAQWENIDPDATKDKLVVIFDRGYSQQYLTPVKVSYGKKVSMPTTPKRDGYIFIGWYLNGELYDFEQPIYASLGLIAKWEQIGIDRIELLYLGGIAGESHSSTHINNYARNPIIKLETDEGKYIANGTVGYNYTIGNYSGGSITVNGIDYTNFNYHLSDEVVETTPTTETPLEDFFESEYILEILNR